MCSDEKIIQNIKFTSLELEKLDIFSRIGDNKIIFYHRKCKIHLENEFRLTEISKKEKNEWHRVREEHKKAFSVVIDFVKSHVIEDKKSVLLSYLKMLFVEELKKLHDNQTEDESASRYVEEKLLNIFKKQLSVRFVKNTKVVVPYGYTILENDLPNLSTDNNIRTAALRLREEILNMPVNKLENYAVDNLIKGECDIPSSLNTFLSTLLRGTTTRRNNSDNAKRSISSIAQDIVFSIHQGRVKTSKHITLGLALKSLTNSKKVIYSTVWHKFTFMARFSVA
ncbi:hypothetical protein TKK_0013928 [Trichogramma kaykai]